MRLRAGLTPDAFCALLATAREWKSVHTAAEASDAKSTSASATEPSCWPPVRGSRPVVTSAEPAEADEPAAAPSTFPSNASSGDGRSKRILSPARARPGCPSGHLLPGRPAALGPAWRCSATRPCHLGATSYLLASAESGSGKSRHSGLIAAPLLTTRRASFEAGTREPSRLQSDCASLTEIALLEPERRRLEILMNANGYVGNWSIAWR